jgi:hypothetical protein
MRSASTAGADFFRTASRAASTPLICRKTSSSRSRRRSVRILHVFREGLAVRLSPTSPAARGGHSATPEYPLTPSVARMLSIMFTIDCRSLVKSSIDGKARRLRHMDFDATPNQIARQPKSVAADLMGQDHPGNRISRCNAAFSRSINAPMNQYRALRLDGFGLSDKAKLSGCAQRPCEPKCASIRHVVGYKIDWNQ